MRRIFAVAVSVAVLAVVNVNAQVDHFYSRGERVSFKLRKDLMSISTTDRNMRGNITNNLARSVFAEARDFVIIEIDTLQTNAVAMTRSLGTSNFANVLEYADGTLQIPTNSIFVRPISNASMEETLDEIRKNGIEVVSGRVLYEGSPVFVVELNVNLNDMLEAVNVLSRNPYFEYVEPNFTRLMRPTNANPLFGDQWGLNNIGQNGGTPGVDVRAINAWEISRGADIKVAVIDEGVQLDHPDLQSNVLADLGFDATDRSAIDPPGSPLAWDNHGTACAGIIAAVDNDIGIIGVAPAAQIVPVRIAHSNGWQWTYDSWIVKGINHARQYADILSNSWGGGSNSYAINAEIDSALINGRGGKGAVVVFSSGNGGGPVLYPANSNPDIIAVGAIDRCGIRSGRIDRIPNSCDPWLPNWQPGSSYGYELDVVAPGTNVYTTSVSSSYMSDFGGTSAAAPHVAGVAALILSVNPELTQKQVADIIESTAQKVGPYTYFNTLGRPNGTWYDEVGYGLVDAYAAVRAAMQT